MDIVEELEQVIEGDLGQTEHLGFDIFSLLEAMSRDLKVRTRAVFVADHR